MTQRRVVEAVLRLVRTLPAYPRLRILDLSAGRGEILSTLQQDGAQVRATHFRTDDYKLVGCETSFPFPIDTAVDLQQPLPYEAGSFDVVLLVEVLEHLETHRTVVNEIGRVLAPEGYLVVSTPNIARLHSRLQFFLTGTHKLVRRRIGWDLDPGELYAYHVNPVDFPMLHTLLFQAGLRVRRLGLTRFKPEHAWLMLLYPLLWLASRYETRHHIPPGERRHGEEDLFHWLVHPALLGSEQLLLLAQKGEAGSRPARTGPSRSGAPAPLPDARAAVPAAPRVRPDSSSGPRERTK